MTESPAKNHKADPHDSIVTSGVEGSDTLAQASQNANKGNYNKTTQRHGLLHSATLHSHDFHALLVQSAEPTASERSNATKLVQTEDLPPPEPTNFNLPTAGAVQPAEAARLAALSYAQHKRRPTILLHSMIGTLSATIAALVATIVVYPLDNVRTRITLKPYHNSFSTSLLFRQILMEEGWKGLYRGLPSALYGVLVSWIANYISFSALKIFFMNRERSKPHFFARYFAKVGASIVSVLLSSPIWLINTRIIMNGYGSSSHNILVLLSEIYKKEGLRGLFAGLIPSQFVNAASSIQAAIIPRLQGFMIFMKMVKNVLIGSPKVETSSTSVNVFPHPFMASQNISRIVIYPAEDFIIGLLSRMLASFVTHPFRVIKARSQCQGSVPIGTAASPNVSEILEHEGIHGLFKGVTTKFLGDAISTVVMFVVYIRVLKLLTNAFLRGSRKITFKN